MHMRGVDILMQGPPLRCRWCPGTLLLNATSLKNHMDSNRHKKRQKMNNYEPNPVCLAENVQSDESVSAAHTSCPSDTLYITA